MKYFLFIFAILFSSAFLYSQNLYPPLIIDSSYYKPAKKDTFWKHTIAPAVFVGLSVTSWEADDNVRTIRNRYTPDFRSTLDNYTQYAPVATVFALKAAGVKGRNKIGRSAINWGGGMLIMGGLVNGLKYSTKVMRPDGSTKNSFPSGHTATAFMNATFMHKEYGHINPLYSVLGYSMATYTGVSRSLNNRHWLSDILAGAGIGILSTELSYLIIDQFYKNKGDFFIPFDIQEELENPSFVSIRLGQAFFLDDFKSFGKLGLEGALESAYFFNRKWGIGGEAGFMHIPFEHEAIDLFEWNELPLDISNQQMDVQSLGFASLMVGGYYNKVLSSKFLLQGKVLTGIGTGIGGNIDFIADKNENGTISEINVPFLEYSVGTSWVVGGGVSFTGMVAPTMGLSLYADYKYANPKAKISISKYYEEIEDKLLDDDRLPISSLTFGVKLISFF
ncbi:phosphatase PAP2 family protein [Dysgonomonas sp. Marseille-P4677]|uniref:phosphatase PAP2 family protein n=1 Tax=Dysgonomonas sp. Marseille-P4677 TaxID=2364790 RepID=UPI00191325C8|nr:phosphatase PAP2 family protein [Dysgonomonas sp. Marseille-P4677]MBK5722293.1 phosphatase PAP2 family protein [Dysgonomonas sp. Marseille-P4677]